MNQQSECQKVSSATYISDVVFNNLINQNPFRMTLDSKAKPGQVKGFVVNPRKADIKAFDFSENDDQVS